MNRKRTLVFPITTFGRILRGVYASRGERRKRIKMISRVRSGVDSSSEDINGGLKSHQPKQKRVRRSSGVRSGVDSSSEDMDGGLKSHKPKLKRVKEMKRCARLQSGVDASSKEIDGGLRSHQTKLKRVKVKIRSASVQSGADALESHKMKNKRAKKKRASREKSRTDYPEQREKERKEEELYKQLIASGLPLYTACNVLGAKGRSFRYSEMALQFFHENQNDEEFELVQPVHSQNLELFPPGCDRFQNCCHVSFTARPKNVGSNLGQKYFFAELLKGENDSDFSVKSCFILERGDCGGVNHGCIICPPILMLHPREGKYVSGSSSYSVVEFDWD